MSDINYSQIADRLNGYVCPEHNQFATVVPIDSGVKILGACCKEFELTLDKAFLEAMEGQIFEGESNIEII